MDIREETENFISLVYAGGELSLQDFQYIYDWYGLIPVGVSSGGIYNFRKKKTGYLADWNKRRIEGYEA